MKLMIYFYRAVESNPTAEVFMVKGGRGDIASSPESMKKISENCIFYLSENGFGEEQIESIMMKYLAEEKL
jgi:hypothetical protein